MRLFALIAASAFLWLGAGCSGAKYQGGVYNDGRMQFRLGPVPSGWRFIESEALVAFRDDQNQATVAVNGRCGKDGDDVPLSSLTHHLFLNFTERTIRQEHRLVLDGREAQLTELDAKLDGVPKNFTVVVLKKDGCVFDFLRIAERADSGGKQEFNRFVHGFATLSGS